MRAMTILSGTARLAGITGWPVSHSRSPRLHGFWLERYGIDGAYLPLPIDPGAFPGGDPRADAVRVSPASTCTIPHKVAAFAVCDTVDESARRAGAVNTLVFENGRITGSNTDGWGFLENLRANGVDPAAGPALILGAGGSARAVAAVLLELGVQVTRRQPHPRPRRGTGPRTARPDGHRLGRAATTRCPTTRCW